MEGRLKCLERNWSRGGSNLNLAAKGLKAMDESANHFVLITAVEVIGAGILVGNTFSEHEVNGCEHRGGDGDDGLLRAAPALEPLELGSQVSAFGPRSAPSRLDERCLQPWRPITYAG